MNFELMIIEIFATVNSFWLDAIVYGFNVDIPKNMVTQAEQLDISIKKFDIIYKLLDDLKVYFVYCMVCDLS